MSAQDQTARPTERLRSSSLFAASVVWIALLIPALRMDRQVALAVNSSAAARLDRADVELLASSSDPNTLLERWRRLTPSEQGKLRERFEEFKAIDVEERERLQRRGRRLDLMARRLYGELPDDDRARMDALPAVKRRELMREMAADKARDVGQRIHDKLPPAIRHRLAQARPQDRARFMEDFRERRRARMGETLGLLGQELAIEDSVIKRIRSLPDEQRGRKFLEFIQRRALREVGRHGLPDGLDIERWRDIGKLPADEFFEAVMGLREQYPAFALPRASIRELAEPQRRVLLAAKRRHADRIELSDLRPADRRREIGRRRRERLEQAAREAFSDEELEAMKELSDRAFRIEVRNRVFVPLRDDAGEQ